MPASGPQKRGYALGAANERFLISFAQFRERTLEPLFFRHRTRPLRRVFQSATTPSEKQLTLGAKPPDLPDRGQAAGQA